MQVSGLVARARRKEEKEGEGGNWRAIFSAGHLSTSPALNMNCGAHEYGGERDKI